MQTDLINVSDIVISNPKLYAEPSSIKVGRLFPYYAGYSSVFAQNVLSSLCLEPKSVVLDPWNGSGTTTLTASSLGYKAIGIDLNPVMVIAAKALMLSEKDASTLLQIADSVVENLNSQESIDGDPLLTWLSPNSTRAIRQIESSINYYLSGKNKYIKLDSNKGLSSLSAPVAFLYVALFKTVRFLLADFIPSNPTWIKRPKSLKNRKRPSQEKIKSTFIYEVRKILTSFDFLNYSTIISSNVVLKLANAKELPISDSSIDAIVSSPPYCTRIDYAVLTSIELAVLRINDNDFDQLRRSLTGTSTVSAETYEKNQRWGLTCQQFLDKIYAHPSRASKTYYYKNHLQYFRDISLSIEEIYRVLKKNGYCFLVVQDSYYKEIHNDVPTMVVEMAALNGLTLVNRFDFNSSKSMASINEKSRKYMKSRITTESVLFFIKSN